jgi:Ca-activated chloride channel family protein
MDSSWSNFRWEWLDPTAWQEAFEWQHPIFLWMLPVVPLLFLLRWLLYMRFRQRLQLAVPSHVIGRDPWAWLRFLPKILLGMAVALMLVALARPQQSNEQVDQWTEGIDIMLVLDISESMNLEDFKPNRLEATKQVAKDFISGRRQDRIGLVIFSGEAISYSPLTNDYDMLLSLVDAIQFRMIEKGGTAIGSAMAVGINRLRESDTPSKVMIVLSDGENNAGSIDPLTAAKLAYAYQVKIYSIGVGSDGRVQAGTDPYGRPIYVENQLDETLLREVAKIGQGAYYRATNNEVLEQVFDRIDAYEKAEIKETRFKSTEDFYQYFLAMSMAFWLGWMLLKSTFMANALED